jgi:hypothetical protein
MSQVITIKAPTKQALSAARTRVELVISSAISSRMFDYTHFLSLPLSNAQTAVKLQEFQKQVSGMLMQCGHPPVATLVYATSHSASHLDA